MIVYPIHALINVISIPVNKANFSFDIFVEIHLPIKTPTILEHNKAKELPKNTIKGLPDSADSINVANCVLSPNSAIKIVVKLVKKIDKKPFSKFLLSSFMFNYLSFPF